MQNLEVTPKSNAQKAFDDLPFWMRQMMQDKVQKCLSADADEQRKLEPAIQANIKDCRQAPELNNCIS